MLPVVPAEAQAGRGRGALPPFQLQGYTKETAAIRGAAVRWSGARRGKEGEGSCEADPQHPGGGLVQGRRRLLPPSRRDWSEGRCKLPWGDDARCAAGTDRRTEPRSLLAGSRTRWCGSARERQRHGSPRVLFKRRRWAGNGLNPRQPLLVKMCRNCAFLMDWFYMR